MIPRIERPTVGLLVTAFLEDEFVKTGYLRARVQTAVQELTGALAGCATVVCPGLVETETQAAAAELAFRTVGVEAIVFAELAYTQSLVPLQVLADAQVPIIVWNTQLLSRWPADADWDVVMLNSGLAGLPETTHARRNTLFSALRTYCGYDTEVMVVIWKRLREIAGLR